MCPLHSSSYAVADNSYRSLRTERKDQCILISGESGAGKTEASKKILQYYAFTCPASEQVQTVKDRLLQSNPVLEVSWDGRAESEGRCAAELIRLLTDELQKYVLIPGKKTNSVLLNNG